MDERLVVLDTETTGLEAQDGHRIIEIGCVEIVNRRLTGRNLHQYLNPEREIDYGAAQVHGMTLDMLQDKPRFGEVAAELLEFAKGATILIHNAPFDLSFLNTELDRVKRKPFEQCCESVLDTLALARELHPGRRNSLDVLCERYGISNAHRTLHGALLDAELLADVYLAMTRGQDSLAITSADQQGAAAASKLLSADQQAWPPESLVAISVSKAELAAHTEALEAIAGTGTVPLWHADTVAAEQSSA